MVRSQYLVAFLLVVVVATGFFFARYQAVCVLPQTYRIGTLDERFGLDRAEAEAAVTDAVAVWEDSIGQDLFATTTSGEDFAVNFIFDDRQARTDAEARARERLAAVEAQSGEVQVEYASLVATLEVREAAYETRAARYDRDLSQYNQTVAEFNAAGGAPPEEFAELEAERERLATESAAINREVASLNTLVDEINQLGEAGNALISRFNDRVETFNETFADGREFTQGDWQGDRINIYSFSDRDELHVVLVHELGHAMGIGHVDDPTAFMHFLLGEQDAAGELRPDDIKAFQGVCSTEVRLASVPQPWRAAFAWFGV
jgi:hypothetical protein